MKKFIVEDDFWRIFPEASIAVLTVKNVQEAAVLDEAKTQEIKTLLEDANEGARCFLTSETISENEVVKA